MAPSLFGSNCAPNCRPKLSLPVEVDAGGFADGVAVVGLDHIDYASCGRREYFGSFGNHLYIVLIREFEGLTQSGIIVSSPFNERMEPGRMSYYRAEIN